MGERARRIGLNEAVFREVNDRVEELSREFGIDDEPLDLLCECGNASCVQRMWMSATEYRDLRSNATHFAVVPGHEIPEVEVVVDRRERYDVVEKRAGDAARIAVETDPRS